MVERRLQDEWFKEALTKTKVKKYGEQNTLNVKSLRGYLSISSLKGLPNNLIEKPILEGLIKVP